MKNKNQHKNIHAVHDHRIPDDISSFTEEEGENQQLPNSHQQPNKDYTKVQKNVKSNAESQQTQIAIQSFLNSQKGREGSLFDAKNTQNLATLADLLGKNHVSVKSFQQMVTNTNQSERGSVLGKFGKFLNLHKGDMNLLVTKLKARMQIRTLFQEAKGNIIDVANQIASDLEAEYITVIAVQNVIKDMKCSQIKEYLVSPQYININTCCNEDMKVVVDKLRNLQRLIDEAELKAQHEKYIQAKLEEERNKIQIEAELETKLEQERQEISDLPRLDSRNSINGEDSLSGPVFESCSAIDEDESGINICSANEDLKNEIVMQTEISIAINDAEIRSERSLISSISKKEDALPISSVANGDIDIEQNNFEQQQNCQQELLQLLLVKANSLKIVGFFNEDDQTKWIKRCDVQEMITKCKKQIRCIRKRNKKNKEYIHYKDKDEMNILTELKEVLTNKKNKNIEEQLKEVHEALEEKKNDERQEMKSREAEKQAEMVREREEENRRRELLGQNRQKDDDEEREKLREESGPMDATQASKLIELAKNKIRGDLMVNQKELDLCDKLMHEKDIWDSSTLQIIIWLNLNKHLHGFKHSCEFFDICYESHLLQKKRIVGC